VLVGVGVLLGAGVGLGSNVLLGAAVGLMTMIALPGVFDGVVSELLSSGDSGVSVSNAEVLGISSSLEEISSARSSHDGLINKKNANEPINRIPIKPTPILSQLKPNFSAGRLKAAPQLPQNWAWDELTLPHVGQNRSLMGSPDRSC
jgi:hypothetical protein